MLRKLIPSWYQCTLQWFYQTLLHMPTQFCFDEVAFFFSSKWDICFCNESLALELVHFGGIYFFVDAVSPGQEAKENLPREISLIRFVTLQTLSGFWKCLKTKYLTGEVSDVYATHLVLFQQLIMVSIMSFVYVWSQKVCAASILELNENFSLFASW